MIIIVAAYYIEPKTGKHEKQNPKAATHRETEKR